jgi:predicted MFS family arabinose efflux permease
MSRWTILAVLFLARTVMALQFQTVASTAPFLRDALAIDFASLGALIGLYMLPGIVIALPGGMLGQRFGAKRVVLLGLAMMALGGVLMGASSSFAPVAAGRLVSGIGAVLFNVMVTKMVADWFAGRELATAMGILMSSWPLGLALGLVFFGPLAAVHGWSAIMHIGALCAVVALALVASLYRDPPGMPASGPAQLRLNLNKREWLLVIIAGTIWAFFNVSYIVLVTFLPELFTQRGYTLVEASGIVSLIGWLLIPTIPLASYLAERFRQPDMIMFASFPLVAAAIATLPFTNAPLVPYSLMILMIGAPAGLIMALPAQALRPENRASGLGIYYTVYYAVMALLPGGAGLARDLSGSVAAPALFAAGMMLLCALGLMLFHAAKRMQER